MLERTLLGLILGAFLSLAAYRLGTLTRGGALAAVAVGTVVFALGGWTPAVLLILFFVSSSLFTRVSALMRPDRQALFAKSGRRDARQVLANGLLPAIFSILSAFVPGINWLAAIVGSLAAAIADTWATEWGVLAVRPPRRISDWQQVPAGTSGGITPLGTFGSLVGALLIGGAASLMQGSHRLLVLALSSGVFGSMLDSLLGASVQVQYVCRTCAKQTEQHPVHAACGTQTMYRSGVSWVDNDVVNLIANTAGGLLALGWVFIQS